MIEEEISNEDTSLNPTEETGTEISVIVFKKRSKEKIPVDSISEAISKIKNKPTFLITKIEIDNEIVYYSERNGTIEEWEKEWKRQKRKISLDEVAWECPHGNVACYENDLCIECKIEKARSI